MEQYITNHRELEKLIDGIPIPDLTVSSVSQQSKKYTPKSVKKQSLTREQIQKILNQSKQPTVKHKTLGTFATLGTFNCKENFQDQYHYQQQQQQQQQDDIIKNNSKLRSQLIEQQNVIESQLIQIAQMNNKIENLTNELLNTEQELQQETIKNQKLETTIIQLKDQQNIELEVLKRVNAQNQQELQTNRQQLYQLQSQNEKQYRSKTSIDPELLSEDDTLSLLFSLLTRISKSRRMGKLVQKNLDFRQLFKHKQSQSSLDKRKLSQTQEGFRQINKKMAQQQQLLT